MRLQSATFWRARPSASIDWNSRRTRVDRLGGGVGKFLVHGELAAAEQNAADAGQRGERGGGGRRCSPKCHTLLESEFRTLTTSAWALSMHTFRCADRV
jgi:hypothetical protein